MEVDDSLFFMTYSYTKTVGPKLDGLFLYPTLLLGRTSQVGFVFGAA